MQKLLVLQSLWAVEGRFDDRPFPTMEDSIERIARAGFDGISAHWTDRHEVRRAVGCLAGTGLAVEGMCLPGTVDALKPILEIATEFPVHHLTVQPDLRPRRLEDGVALIEGWRRLVEEVDFPVYVETHRGRLTSDLLFTMDLLDACPELRLLADLSHYLVGREFAFPVGPDDQALVHRILDRSWAFHGRVASPGQVQVALSNPHNAPWLRLFEDWWRYGFRSWRRRSGPDDTLSFTCELGPRPYAIVGPDGHDTTDRWAEALQLRDVARHLWESVEHESREPDAIESTVSPRHAAA